MSEPIQQKKIATVVWLVWAVFILGYLSMNAWFLFGRAVPDATILLAWGIAMPILTNLVWWVISFRFRQRIEKWWMYGIVTAAVVGIAGFLSMFLVSRVLSGGG